MFEIANAGDLRTAYLQVFDSFALVPSDIVDSSEGRVNIRYARELLGVLVDAGLVVVSEGGDGNDGFDVWQTFPDTYDNMSREEAEAKIDAFLNDPTTHTIENPKGKTMTENTKTKAVTGSCYCGCKADLTGKGFYKPGHDARHAGQIGRLVAEDGNTDHYNDLPSDALVAKSKNITANALAKEAKKDAAAKAKAEAKASKGDKPATVIEQGIIKVGKNEYVATRNSTTGEVTYFKGEDEKVASKAASATFTIG